MIAIIDYGMGNIHSVRKAVESFGAKAFVSASPKDIERADKVVLPGVGAFSDAMEMLKRNCLDAALKEYINSKRPFLGICLGLQLLFETSEEAKGVSGLGVLKGSVKKFPAKLGLKVPHIGWNQLKKVSSSCLLLKDIPENTFVYFCHSYFPAPADKKIIAAATTYGVEFASLINKDNLYGAQFHPEKSQEVGLKILENFVRLC